MNHDYYHEQNPCYDSTSIGFDQSQPQQYTLNHHIFNAHNDYLDSPKKLTITLTNVTEQMTSLNSMCELACQIVQKKLEEKQLEEEQAAKALVMSSDSHATITYTSMSSYEVIVNRYYGMPMDPLDPYVQLVMEAPPLPDYIPGPEAPPSPDYILGPKAPPSPDYIPGPEYPEYLPPADDMLPDEEQPLPATVSPTAESLGYIT
nr:hypothetical protein [Tanacetum cinerariifolium]